MAQIATGGSVAGKADVDDNFNLKVITPIDKDLAGFSVIGGMLDSGEVTGNREIIPYGVSEDGRISIGADYPLWNDTFNSTAQNTTNYRVQLATQTAAFSGGYVILNNSAITTINTNSAFQTYRTFPVLGSFGLAIRMACLHTFAPQTNAVTEWGLFTATIPGGAIPTDGLYFRFTNAGEFRAVVNYNGTEVLSAALPVPSANVNHDYEIFVNQETTIFKMDKVVVFDVDNPAGFSQMFASGSLPFTMRHYIGGSAPANAMQFKIGSLNVNFEDILPQKPWSHAMAGMSLSGYQGQNGGTLGTTALYANSSTPAAVVPTNTTAALGTGLGGNFQETLTLAANTDGIISSYQNPAGSVTQTPRTLYVTGVSITGIVITAPATSPFAALWSIAFGHTNVSLATTESATAKAPRRVGIGASAVTVAAGIAGTLITGPSIKFDTPIVVSPGEFFQTVKKNLITAPTAGAILWNITVDSYWE